MASVALTVIMWRRKPALLKHPFPQGVCDGSGDQPLTGLAGVDVAQKLVGREGVEQPGLARAPTSKRIRGRSLEGGKRVGDDRALCSRGSCQGLIETLDNRGLRDVVVVRRVVARYDNRAVKTCRAEIGQNRFHVHTDDRECLRQTGGDTC